MIWIQRNLSSRADRHLIEALSCDYLANFQVHNFHQEFGEHVYGLSSRKKETPYVRPSRPMD